MLQLERRTLSAVRDFLFDIFPATFHNWRRSPPSATWGSAEPWRQEPTYVSSFVRYYTNMLLHLSSYGDNSLGSQL